MGFLTMATIRADSEYSAIRDAALALHRYVVLDSPRTGASVLEKNFS